MLAQSRKWVFFVGLLSSSLSISVPTEAMEIMLEEEEASSKNATDSSLGTVLPPSELRPRETERADTPLPVLLDDEPTPTQKTPSDSTPSTTPRKRIVVDEDELEEAARGATLPHKNHGRFVWISLQQDFSLVGADNPCAPTSQQIGSFSCFRSNGTQYLGTPAETISPSTGILIATTRVLAGYEHFITEQFAVAAWAGFAFRGGAPRSVGAQAAAFLPLHLEVQTTWWPSSSPRSGAGLSPFLLLGGGMAQIDAHFKQNVVEDVTAPRPIAQLDNPQRQILDAYKKSGTGFVNLGAGLIAPINDASLWRVGLECLVSFPAPGVTLALEAGIGFDL